MNPHNGPRISTVTEILDQQPASGNLSMASLFQRSMNRKIVKGGVLFASLLALITCQGCMKLQRAVGCDNTGIFGCKDKPSEIQPPDPELRRAPPAGRAQHAPEGDGRYLEGHEYPWSQPLDDCMAAGGTRTECFASLPADILEQFEAWEAERAVQRRRQLQQRLSQPSFGVEPVAPASGD